MTPELRRQAEKAVQVTTADGRHLAGGRAVIFVLEEIRWHATLVHLAGHRPFIWLVELGYRIVARHREFFARFLAPSNRRQ